MAKILLIESSPADAQSAREAFETRGDATELTGEAGHAVDLARSMKPDLIVLCVELDTGSGYSICNKVRRDVELGQIPLILTSREATAETFEQHRRLKTHADFYLSKPYTQEELVAAVDRLLGRAVINKEGEAQDSQGPATHEDALTPSPSPAAALESSTQHEAGTVELDLSEEAIRSLALAVDVEVGAIVDPAKKEDPSSKGNEPSPGSNELPKSAEAADIVFDEQAWEVPEDLEQGEAATDESKPADLGQATPDLRAEETHSVSQEVELESSSAPAEDAKAELVTQSHSPRGGEEHPHDPKRDAYLKEIESIRDDAHRLLGRLDAWLALERDKK